MSETSTQNRQTRAHPVWWSPTASREVGTEAVPTFPAVSGVPTGPTKIARGGILPRHFTFTEISTTPDGHAIWLVVYGLATSGGLTGETEDVEYQVLGPDGSGTASVTGTFTGTLDDRSGGFAYEAKGHQNSNGSFVLEYDIVRETGYDDLEGISGHFSIVGSRDHCGPTDTPETCDTLVSYTLTYRQPAA